MNRRCIQYSFGLPAIVFFCHQWMQYVWAWQLDILDCYLDPCCLGALSCQIILWEKRSLFGVQQLSILDLVIITMILAIISEGVFPYYSDAFITDVKDVLSIGLGVFWFAQTTPKKVAYFTK